MSKRRLMTAGGALAVALAAAPMSALHSQTTASQDSAMRRTWGINPGLGNRRQQARLDVRADTGSVREVVAGNLLEIQLGNLAERKATNPAVKQFAQQMVTDHTTMEKQWTALGARNGVPVPALDPAGRQAMSQLERLSGTDFDRAYMTSMVQDHQQTVNVLQRLGQQAQSPDVRQLAANGLPTVQQHLTMARQVESQIGRMAGIAVTPQNPQPSQVTTNGQAARPSDKESDALHTDRELVRLVTEDHIFEVRMGEMAQRKAKNSEIKEFSGNMLADFNKWQNRWEELVQRSRTAAVPGLGSAHEPKVDRLQDVSGEKFDRLYVATVVDHLQSFLPSLQETRRSAHSSEVRKAVDDELPMLRQRLAEAKRLSDRYVKGKESKHDKEESTRK
jgi:putative membrane protein